MEFHHFVVGHKVTSYEMYQYCLKPDKLQSVGWNYQESRLKTMILSCAACQWKYAAAVSVSPNTGISDQTTFTVSRPTPSSTPATPVAHQLYTTFYCTKVKQARICCIGHLSGLLGGEMCTGVHSAALLESSLILKTFVWSVILVSSNRSKYCNVLREKEERER